MSQQHHYYASSTYDWVTRPTESEAILAIAKMSGSMVAKYRKWNKKGLPVYVCKVNLPGDAAYRISQYVPHRVTNEDGTLGDVVPIESARDIFIVNNKGAYIENTEQPN